MNRTALTLAAALGLAAVAGPARADHDDGWRDREHHERFAVPAPEAAYPAPAHAPPAYGPPAYGPPAYGPPGRGWRMARWEGWRFRELREAYRRLDLARDRFYATWQGQPWRRDRFEAWYGARRAELDQRRSELLSWRDHDRW
jgi:hypothetical protein